MFSKVGHEHLRQRHLTVVPVRAVCDGTDKDGNPTYGWWRLKPVRAVAPQTHTLSNVPRLVKAVRRIALAMVPE